ncbi:hypothetical protein IMG5_174610 [Ichthyophthirius multifiliis]|uniref:Transmembrane protein n=1 Tax=Ichthyophthirius multifiliis TaxID=5932 RepID=G0R234_ICHMU|nr:hypothetical protein IMG5_174610 [Ichthyophthirius multifiliis]EGR28476.1 hypothetical protein IMG5_174610 [Ichthyophthirius multifiliis]|eukprot:XP_004029712.1 hypothetical protein IMG5_174610 [Ichthyophthirius multifiliis]
MIFYIYKYIKQKRLIIKIGQGTADFEEIYIYNVQSQEEKQISNALLTNIFIYLTQLLALFLTIYFCILGKAEIYYLMTQYENTPEQSDRYVLLFKYIYSIQNYQRLNE